MRGNTHRTALLAALMLLLGSLATALVGTRVQAAVDPSPAQDNIIISEFRTSGPTTNFEGLDDFVEIFNPTNQEIDIGGWFIKSITSSGFIKTQLVIARGTTLLPGQYYLIAGTYYSGSSAPDGQFLSNGIPDNGGVALIGADSITIIDKAGMNSLTAEGTPLTQLGAGLDQSYERKPGGSNGSCSDSDDNAADFVLRIPSDPQNSTTVLTGDICGAATKTASPTSTGTATSTAVYTFTDTDTVENTPTLTGTATHTQTQTGAPIWTRTFTHTPSPMDTAIPTETPTYTLTRTDSPVPVITKTGTYTPGLSRTLTYTRTDTYTRTASVTRTATLTKTPTRTPSFTRTSSPTRTLTYTRTNTDIHTSTVSRTASLTRTITRTRTSTRTVTAIPGFVIIHEFLPYPHSDWSEDRATNTGDEYIELINLSATSVNIKNWKLDNGADSHPFILPDMNLLPRQIKVFFRFETNIPLDDGGGTVRLAKSDGQTADIFTYPPVEMADRTWCRLFNGNGSLTFACDPTPGKPNVPFRSASAPLSARFACLLPDVAPAAMVTAECDRIGAGIWKRPMRIELWMSKQGKWETFVE